MQTKLLGQFLLEQGLLTSDELLHVLQEQRKSSPRIGELAVALGHLTMTDMELIHFQQKHRNERFGEIAVATKFLDQQTVDELLDYQKSTHRLMGQILLAYDYVTEEELDWALRELAVESTGELDLLLKDLTAPIERKFALIAFGVVKQVYEKVLGQKLDIVRRQDREAPMQRLTWCQEIKNGEDEYLLEINADERTAALIATNMLGFEITAIDELTIDAVSEFLNMAVGHVCSKLRPVGDGVSAQPPMFIEDARDRSDNYFKYIALDGRESQITCGISVGGSVLAQVAS